MSVSVKGKRKIVVDDVVYYWYIRKDRYYDGAFFITYGTPYSLNIIAEDKSLYVNVPVGGDKNTVNSRNQKVTPNDRQPTYGAETNLPLLQSKNGTACVGFRADEITPGFVREVILNELQRKT